MKRFTDTPPLVEGSATAVRAFLKKHYGLKIVSAFWHESNPYSGVQTLEGTMSRPNVVTLARDAARHGWNVERDTYAPDNLERYHIAKGKNAITIYAGDWPWRVTIRGQKKAKATTLPYYD